MMIFFEKQILVLYYNLVYPVAHVPPTTHVGEFHFNPNNRLISLIIGGILIAVTIIKMFNRISFYFIKIKN